MLGVNTVPLIITLSILNTAFRFAIFHLYFHPGNQMKAFLIIYFAEKSD